MIDKLKKASEFLGYRSTKNWTSRDLFVHITDPKQNVLFEDFNPHEKEGRHWQIEILRKFSEQQSISYYNKIIKVMGFKTMQSTVLLLRDIQTTPSEICFNCIIEVLENK